MWWKCMECLYFIKDVAARNSALLNKLKTIDKSPFKFKLSINDLKRMCNREFIDMYFL